MNDKYTIKKSCREDAELRRSFNELAGKAFGLDFEEWYQKGYWGEKYIPYALVYGDIVIANASASTMDFDCGGKLKKYVQLGTVMTEETYRNQGLARRLIDEIMNDYGDKVDGFFLYANDHVVNFYSKFGFRKATEYQYSKAVRNTREARVVQISMDTNKDLKVLEKAVLESVSNSAFEMKNNVDLIMFYIINFMKESVFYFDEQQVYVIAEIMNEHLHIHNVFSQEIVNMNQIIEAFGENITKVTFGFTPLNRDEYDKSEIHENDTTLFLLGKDFDCFEDEEKMFPTLAHA